MIIPQPESDLSLNLMIVGADIIEILKKQNEYIVVDKLLKEFVKNDSRRTPKMFFNAFTYLYALGIVNERNYKVRLINYDTQTNLL